MRFLWIILFLSVATVLAEGKRKRKFEGDFEFADDVESKSNQKSIDDHKKWIHDPNSELCKPLNCKKKEMCLLDESLSAYCINKKEIHKNGDVIVPRSKMMESSTKDNGIDAEVDEDDDEDDDDDDEDDDDIFYDSEDGQDEDESNTSQRCKACAIMKPVFLCGSDNRTYSSFCRLEYHNCLHKTRVKVSCKGFCPCKVEVEPLLKKKQKQAERMSNVMAKFRSTVEREKANKYKTEKGLGNDGSEKNYDNLEKSYRTLKYSSKTGTLVDKNKLQDKYSYVPEEFKYDNKHYKYIKYKKYNKEIYGNDDKSQNEVIETKVNRPGKECSSGSLQLMGNRLLDWFSVVMSESKKRKQPKIKADLPSWCKNEVRWMFAYLDLDGDEKLSLLELYHLEHDHSEKCVKPFVDSCDSDRDIFISPKEWCHCFEKTDRPCAAAKRRSNPGLLGAFVPECDNQGYFRSTQCHSSTGMCWCVNKHGTELTNSRTRGKPNCEKLLEKSKTKEADKKKTYSEKIRVDDEDGDGETDDSDLEGSGDQPLDF